jgi:NAD(P)H-dependent FMN reductase
MVLTVSGSLRSVSTSSAVLAAAARLAPPDVRLRRYERIGNLPPFNPDVEEQALPPEVDSWRRAVGNADAMLISTPEYAHGVPGALKNALDWLVGGPEFVGKPVAVINPSPHSAFAQVQLLETLRTMAGLVVEGASVTLPTRPAPGDGSAIVREREMSAVIREAVTALGAVAARNAGVRV